MRNWIKLGLVGLLSQVAGAALLDPAERTRQDLTQNLSSPTPSPSPSPSSSPSASPIPPLSLYSDAQFDRVEESTLFFKAPVGKPVPPPLKTKLVELQYVGELRPAPEGEPYFFFTGKDCTDCIDPKSIYVLRPSGGTPLTFVYPGKIFDPKTRNLLIESRVFLGKCLQQRGDALVIFQNERVDRRHHLQPSVLVEEPAPSYLQESLIERHLPKLAQTLALVKKKVCVEISSSNRMMLSKPLDLHPPVNQETEEP